MFLRTVTFVSSRLDDSSASISRVIIETHVFAKKTEAVIEEERKVSSAILESVFQIAEVTDGNMNLMQWMGVAVTRLKDLVEKLLPEVDHFQIDEDATQDYYHGQVSTKKSEPSHTNEQPSPLSVPATNENTEIPVGFEPK